MTLRPSRKPVRDLLGRARKQQGSSTRATREEERRRKVVEKQDIARERERAELQTQRQHGRAVKQTMKAEQRVQKLTTILHASLADEPKPLDFNELKTPVTLPPLDLGADAEAEPAPEWKEFAPSYRSAFVHLIFRREQYSRNVAKAVAAYETAVRQHHEREQARLERVAAATRRRDETCSEQQRELREKNREVDEFRHRVRDRDRHAATEYFQLVLDRMPKDPAGLPKGRRVGYAPESGTVTVEWLLPQTQIVPIDKEYRYDEATDEIVVHKKRSAAEIHRVYFDMAAQIALRTLNVIFGSDPYNLVETVVFNGVVEDVGEVTGRSVRTCVLTLCATRPRFRKLKLDDITDAVEVIRKQFDARLSAHPEDFDEVPALRPFALADPDVIVRADEVRGDPRPDLLTLTPSKLQEFLADLLDRMGLDVLRFSRTEEHDLTCVAFDPTPVAGGTIVVLTRFSGKVIAPSDVRALYGLLNRESAIKGLLFAASRFQPTSVAAARGKPLELYDGPSVLALCHQHHLPARMGDIANVTTGESGPPAVFVPTQRQPSADLEPTHLESTPPKIS